MRGRSESVDYSRMIQPTPVRKGESFISFSPVNRLLACACPLVYDKKCENFCFTRKSPIQNLGLVTAMGRMCGGPVATVW